MEACFDLFEASFSSWFNQQIQENRSPSCIKVHHEQNEVRVMTRAQNLADLNPSDDLDLETRNL